MHAFKISLIHNEYKIIEKDALCILLSWNTDYSRAHHSRILTLMCLSHCIRIEWFWVSVFWIKFRIIWPPSIPLGCAAPTRAIWVKLYAVCASWHSVVLVIKRVYKSKYTASKKNFLLLLLLIFFYLSMTYACAYSKFFREHR